MSIFRSRNFAVLISGQAVSVMGNNLYQVALPWLVYSVTGSRTDLALTGLALTLPGALGLFSGVIVDRFYKKKVMIFSDVIRAFLSITLFTLAAVKGSIWLMLLMVFLLEVAGVFFSPASEALLPTILPSDEIPAAVGVFQSTYASAQLAGSVGGGTLLQFVGAPILFLSNAVSFVVSIVSLFFIHSTEEIVRKQRSSLLQDWKEGMTLITRSKFLLRLIAAATLVNFCFSPFAIAMTDWVKTSLHSSSSVLGVIMASSLAGVIVGGLSVGKVLKRYNITSVLISGLITFGFTALLIPLLKQPWWTMSMMAAGGVAQGLLNSAIGGLMMQTVPKHMLGRFYGALMALLTIASPLGVLIFGSLMIYVPIQLIFVIMGVGSLVSAALFFIPIENDLSAINDRYFAAVE